MAIYKFYYGDEKCHLQIKTAPFLVDFHFKSALLILSYP